MIVATAALAHPTPGPPSPDALERRADAVVLGPHGCFTAPLRVDLVLGDARAAATGTVVLDHGRWRVERWTVAAEDERWASVRVAPMLMGTIIDSDLRWPLTRGRFLDWPAPVATVPLRLAGEVDTVSVDRTADGLTVVRSFEWRRWKRVAGERRVRFDPEDRPVSVVLAAADRWPGGCRVDLRGEAALGRDGLPQSERWEVVRRCPTGAFAQQWTFSFDPWLPCGSSLR